MKQVKRFDKSICKNDLKPDTELLAWDKWIQVRKEEIKHLAKKTGRSPVDLVMNTLENVREKKERQTLLENAQIQRKVAIRNNVIWEDPARLKQICSCNPIYEAQRTKAELGKSKVIERIGVPKMIQETEKGVTGISKKSMFPKLNADYRQYRQRREYELENNIKKLDPYRSEIDSLIVIGKKPGLSKEANISVPTFKLDTDNLLGACEECAVYAVQINKSIYYKCLQHENLREIKNLQNASNLQSSWSYYFNTPVNKMGRATLFLKNLGTVCLRYHWEKIVKFIEFVPQDMTETVFFFNKSDDVLYPGQEKNIFFTFLSNSVNIFKESWEIKFDNITFLETYNDKLEINLIADVTENLDIIQRKVYKIRDAIEYRALKNMIKQVIEGIIAKATNEEYKTYAYKDLLLEAEIFEMKNSEFFYHETKVEKLKKQYTDMTLSNWELSVEDWRKEMMKLEFEGRIKYYELLKTSNRELLKPKKVSDDILRQKYKAVKSVFCQFVDKFHNEYSNIIKELDVTDIDRKEKLKGKLTYLQNNSRNPNEDYVHYIFYLRMYSHICSMVEVCAGLISGIDLNRRITFNFFSK